MDGVTFDFREVDQWARHLGDVSYLPRVEDAWAEAQGRDLVHIMRGLVPVGPGEPVHLRDALRVVEDGVTAGEAYWWRFLEYGTMHMPAEPFVRPAVDQQANRAAEDLGDRIIRELIR